MRFAVIHLSDWAEIDEIVAAFLSLATLVFVASGFSSPRVARRDHVRTEPGRAACSRLQHLEHRGRTDPEQVSVA
ncbi:MAG TPA: hypothetical protein VJ204_08680, partial [Solirubrobacterales bacterium]|nr:hypothetical protein [Solirubrobacterales bacterium]